MTEIITELKKELKARNINFAYYNNKRKNGRRIKITIPYACNYEIPHSSSNIDFLQDFEDMIDKAHKVNLLKDIEYRTCNRQMFNYIYTHKDYIFYL